MESFLYIKSKIRDVELSSFRSNSKKDHHFENISEEKCKAFLRLKNNRNIIIQKTDKGKTAVALD